MTVELRIIRTKGGVSKNFIFETGEIKTTGKPQTSQSVSLTVPKDSPTDDTKPFVVDLGVQKELSFTFKIYGQTTDRSEGTNAAVQTYDEILDYLEDVICFPGVGEVEYQITITDKFRTRTDLYTFEDFNLDVDSGLYPTGNMKFKWMKKIV